ncbi:juvenile hormone esterase-like isoform X2 [Arctopsyche grandis]
MSTKNMSNLKMPQPIVTVSEGKLQGGSCKTIDGVQYDYFLGIPYANPPVGNLRFSDPQPPKKWDDVRDAVTQRSIIPQFDLRKRQIVGDENSLFLNVFTPSSTPNTSKLPVMVYIHGGGFYVGSGNFERFRPDFFIQKEIVYVTINYRLSVFGFLCLHNSEVPGNAGLKDQVLALRWVQKNIHTFGGDPQNVTLIGASAGAVSVHYHLMSPMSRGLFSKAIMQSGTCLNSWGIQNEPEKNVFDLAKNLGLDTSDKVEALNFLRSVSAEDLVEASRAEFTYKSEGVFSSVIERSYHDCESFITESPIELMKSGNYAIVPCIKGFVSHEGLNFMDNDTLTTISNGKCPISVEELKVLLQRNHNPNILTEEVERFHQFYFGDSNNLTKGVVDFISDFCFTKFEFQSVKLLRKHNKSVFFYLLNYRGLLNMPLHRLMDFNVGTAHGEENNYFFKREKDDLQLTESDKIVRKRLTTMWTNFAKFGNPTPHVDEIIDTIWKPTSEKVIDCLEITQNLEMICNPLSERMSYWEK